jgi:Trm5-related predicted tRNA methylase
MIDEYGIDHRRDKSRGMKRAISELRIKNSRTVVSSGMVVVSPVLIGILRSWFKMPDKEVSQQAQKVRDGDLREGISEVIKSKHLLVLTDP